MSRKSATKDPAAALVGDVASGTASGEKSKREQSMERVLTRQLAAEMTRRDRDGKLWTEGDVDKWASALITTIARQGWKIYPDGMACQTCRRPFNEEETEEAAKAANSRRKALADIFSRVQTLARCDARTVLDATEMMLATLDSACEIFEVWSAEGEGLTPTESEMHQRLYDAAVKGRAALRPEPEEEQH